MSQSDAVLLLLLITSLDRRQKCRAWVASLMEAANPIPNSSCHQGLSDTYNMPLGYPRRESARNNSEAQLPCVRLVMGWMLPWIPSNLAMLASAPAVSLFWLSCRFFNSTDLCYIDRGVLRLRAVCHLYWMLLAIEWLRLQSSSGDHLVNRQLLTVIRFLLAFSSPGWRVSTFLVWQMHQFLHHLHGSCTEGPCSSVNEEPTHTLLHVSQQWWTEEKNLLSTCWQCAA